MNEQRKLNILKLLGTHGMITVVELCDQLKVSQATIRRDLAEMEQLELIRRINGGAMLPVHPTILGRIKATAASAMACLYLRLVHNRNAARYFNERRQPIVCRLPSCLVELSFLH